MCLKSDSFHRTALNTLCGVFLATQVLFVSSLASAQPSAQPPAQPPAHPSTTEALTDAQGQPRSLAEARRLLRRLSFDVWGAPPSEEAMMSLSAWPTEEEALEGVLTDERAQAWLVDFHENLLWPALEIGDIINPAASLLLPATFYEGPLGGQQLFTLFTGLTRRGGLVPCLDEPATWDEEGALHFERLPDGTLREGYVWVTPYWSEEPVKVCALEAQAQEEAPGGVSCERFEGLSSGYCGCGAALERCASIESALTLLASFRSQLTQFALEHSTGERPYSELYTRRDEPINGPIAHYYRHLASAAVDPVVLQSPVQPDVLPALDFKDNTTWVWAEREATLHSGALTTLPFLLRFQTARARAHRVSQTLLCEPFVAASGVLPSPEDECSQEPNLRARCGCAECHARLEPLAAHWARFADAGALYLNPTDFPSYQAECAACADGGFCSDVCRRFYVSEAPTPAYENFLGVLKAYEFRSREELSKVEAGPRALIEQAVASGRLPQCIAQQLFERFVGRLPTSDELPRVRAYGHSFTEHGDFSELVRDVLRDEAYQHESAALWGPTSQQPPSAHQEEQP